MRNRALVAAVLALVALAPVACGSSGRPSGVASTPTTTAAPSGVGDATASAATVAAPATTVDPGSLPQTRDQPTTGSAAFASGVQALWAGIVADDPARAMPFFFPLSAYRQVKAVHDPPADWQNRLVAAYSRDLHALHRQLGGDAATATLVGLDVPHQAAVWVEPGQEANKLGYWRVYGSALHYRVGGTEHTMAIYSLISWRGEWYVVHITHP